MHLSPNMILPNSLLKPWPHLVAICSPVHRDSWSAQNDLWSHHCMYLLLSPVLHVCSAHSMWHLGGRSRVELPLSPPPMSRASIISNNRLGRSASSELLSCSLSYREVNKRQRRRESHRRGNGFSHGIGVGEPISCHVLASSPRTFSAWTRKVKFTS